MFTGLGFWCDAKCWPFDLDQCTYCVGFKVEKDILGYMYDVWIPNPVKVVGQCGATARTYIPYGPGGN